MKKILLPFICTILAAALAPCSYAQSINTVAGSGAYGDSGDGGPASGAAFEYVWFNAVDTAGNIYITDNFDHKVRKVNTAGIISTFAGNGGVGYTGDGGPATNAEFIGAAGIATDHAGNVYFSDINNRRIRKVNASGYIYTIAGTGVAGFSGDGGPATAAELNNPYGVASDDSGNVYVADELNFRVRKISLAGIITTVAGTGVGGYSGDSAAATLAQITPTGIAIDAMGNLYIATNNRIRMVNSAGIISTVAGNGIAGFSGDGGPATVAKLNQPVGIAADGLGNIFIADQYNNRIRKVNGSGIITSIAGTGTAGFSGDGGAATAAKLAQPIGICTDPAANVYFCDYSNLRVRKIISGNHIPSFIHGPLDSIVVCQNSIGDSLNSLLAITDADSGQTETWVLLAPALHGIASTAYSSVATGDTIMPSGLYYSPSTGYSGQDTLQVRVDDGQSLDTITIYLSVRPLPDTGMITGDPNVCMGTPDVLANATTGGIWSAVNAAASISSSGIVTGIMPGVDTIRNTFTANGCSSFASFLVTVFPISDTITGPSSVCTGLSISLNGSPAGGAWNVSNDLATVSGGILLADTAGVDTVIYTISNVCGVFFTTAPVTIIGFTIPTVNIASYPATILAGQNDTLVAQIMGGGGITYGYQWERNSTIIPGATDSVYFSNTFLDGDSITCFIHNGPCNFETFAWSYIAYHNDGINDIDAGAGLRLAPNPSKGSFLIEGPWPTDSHEADLEITDMLGRVVYKDAATIANGTIRKRVTLGDDLENGVYLLHLLTDDGRKVIPFTIAR